MSVLRGFAPFVVFVLGARFAPVHAALRLAFATALAIFGWSRVRDPGAAPKVLELGSVVLFGLIALGAQFLPMPVGLAEMRLAVDVGLCVVVLVSLAIGKPFTLQYARERTPRRYWSEPRFIRTNVEITSAWAIGFAIDALADALLAFVPAVPLWCDIALAATGLGGAGLYSAYAAKRGREAHAA